MALVTRSQTAYTRLASVGSAVIEPLSLKNCAPSAISVCGADQEVPPSADRATRIALDEPGASVSPLKTSASAYAVPAGEKLTQGSDARSKSPPFARSPPVQREKDTIEALHRMPAVRRGAEQDTACTSVGPPVLLPGPYQGRRTQGVYAQRGFHFGIGIEHAACRYAVAVCCERRCGRNSHNHFTGRRRGGRHRRGCATSASAARGRQQRITCRQNGCGRGTETKMM